MKFAFVVYHDVLDERISTILSKTGIDYYTEWEEVKGKGHLTDAHLGTRPFPGYNCVRMIAFEDEVKLEKLIEILKEFNKEMVKKMIKFVYFSYHLKE